MRTYKVKVVDASEVGAPDLLFDYLSESSTITWGAAGLTLIRPWILIDFIERLDEKKQDAVGSTRLVKKLKRLKKRNIFVNLEA